MTTLREHILAQLAGSTSQKPIYLSDLRKKADPICDDPNVLHKALDDLYLERLVGRCAGEKKGEPYMAYWLSGVVGIVQTFAHDRTIPPRRVAIREESKVQPNTAKVQPSAAILVKPNKEQAMSKPATAPRPRKLYDVILDTVMTQPGITRYDLIAAVLADESKPTQKQIDKGIWDLLNTKNQLCRVGSKTEQIKYFLTTNFAAMHACITNPTDENNAIQTKPSATAKVIKPSKPIPAGPVAKPTLLGPIFDCQVSILGHMTISKGDQRIELNREEAHKFTTFIVTSRHLTAIDAVTVA